ncbi:hypothetical protein BDQ17DRAFT_1396190 [Cyathus striatus]|nr:hypothetical protein BDQ17DRAFT_1396190 [Cyathus striatus]
MMPPRALHFMGLNIVRFFSVVSLILVFASTILVMVTNIKAVNAFMAAKDTDMEDCDYIEGSTVPNQPAGVFWAVVASLLIIFQTIVLLMSELSWPLSFFDKYFPILSHHVDDFTLVAAFFLFAVGCINMLLGLIYREYAKDKRSIRAWRAEAKGILPSHTDNRPVFVNATPSYVSSVFAGGDKQQQEDADFATWKSTEKAGEKAAGLRGFILQKPDESLPRYATPPPKSVASCLEEVPPMPHMPVVRSATPPVFKSSPTAI